jgi:6-phosphofructokinase 1
MKRVGILTSGGDAPGMNAAIRAAVLVARAHGCQVIGVERGYRGLLEGEFVELGPGDVAAILREGGTVLGSARCPEFLAAETRGQARTRLRERGLEALLVIGGNGSLAGALALSDAEEAAASGPPAPAVIGVPASIDNDIGLTRMAIGVDTALNTIVEACDKIADTASAHHRAFLIEVMGRECGYLAMAAYVAVGADLVLFPEAAQREEALVASVIQAIRASGQRAKHGRVIVIVAEGVPITTHRLKELVDAHMIDERKRGGPAPVETRVTVLGHVVRGGRPSAFDRLLASRLGNAAVRALLAGKNRMMAAWMPALDLVGQAGERSVVDPHCWLVDMKAVMAETKRLLDGTSPAVAWRAQAMNEALDAMLL